MDFQPLILSILQDILYLLLSMIMFYGFRYIKQKLSVEQIKEIKESIETEESIARTAVLAAQKILKDNEDKFDYAYEYISKEATRLGFELTPEKIDTLIQAVLKLLKKEFGEQWKEL